MNKKIIFMGTPLVASNYLNVLIENKYEVVSVITQPPRKKKSRNENRAFICSKNCKSK